MSRKIEIFDSTLRDGMQSAGISFSVEDKIKIVKALDALGVDYIEAGNPASNPKDIEFFARAKEFVLTHAKLVAFGSTTKVGCAARDDKNCLALLQADTEDVAVFGKTWDLHVSEVLMTTLEENLRMIADTIQFLTSKGKNVFFDSEHFFDGYKANPSYAMQVLTTAKEAGARVLVLCDTNGGCFPQEIAEITAYVVQALHAPIGIHTHNDTGCGVANSIMAVEAGACHLQGTYIGFGERCGNANLSTLIGNLQIKRGYDCIPAQNLKRLTKTARYLAEVANMGPQNDLPYVGANAFSHKGGMHVDGVNKLNASFEHINPQEVGNKRHTLLSEMAGRTAILQKIHSIDSSITKESPQAQHIVQLLKELEYEGYQFELADASFKLLVLKELKLFHPYFELVSFRIVGEKSEQGSNSPSSAMVKVRVEQRYEITADEGEGPVHALDKALRKALEVFYPKLSGVRLCDYKVRVMDSEDATASKVRVTIESTDGENVWTTIGVSADIIQASTKALVDSMEYKLAKDDSNVPL